MPGVVATSTSSPAPLATRERELLGERPAPGHAEHIDRSGVAQFVEHALGQAREPAKTVRRPRRRRPAAPGTSNTMSDAIQRLRERLHQLQVRADAVEHEQRAPLAFGQPDPQAVTIDIDMVNGEVGHGRHDGTCRATLSSDVP